MDNFWLLYCFSQLNNNFGEHVQNYLVLALSVWRIIISMHFRITLHSIFPECYETPCSKQVRNLKFNWLQLHLNPQPLSLQTNTQRLSHTSQIIELCSDYLSVRYIWLYILMKSCAHFSMNSHSIVAWMSKNSLLYAGTKSKVQLTATGFERVTA